MDLIVRKEKLGDTNLTAATSNSKEHLGPSTEHRVKVGLPARVLELRKL